MACMQWVMVMPCLLAMALSNKWAEQYHGTLLIQKVPKVVLFEVTD
jgi:hypothetical protein